MTDGTNPHSALQHERLLFFSDAVFAIAITLAAIELRLPRGVAGDASLQQALADLLPNLISFVVSFFVIGRFWIGHHRLFGYLAHSDAGLVWRNLAYLAVIALLPFPTAVIGEHGGTTTAILLYSGWLLVAGIGNLAIIFYVQRHPELLAAPMTAAERRALRSAWQPLVVAIAAAAVGFASPPGAIVTLCLLPPALLAVGRLAR